MFVSEIFDEASEILGTTDESKVYRVLTQAVQTLMESGHWFHTTQEVDVCTGWDGITLTLPRGVEVPLAVNIDGTPTYFRGRLFQYHVNKGGNYDQVGWAWDDRGFVSTQMDVRQPSQLIAVAEHENDVGKTLRVVGTDGNNRDLRTQTLSGEGLDGLILQIHSRKDFENQLILPDGNTILTRQVSVKPITQLTSSNHDLTTGQAVVLSSASGSVPPELSLSNTYYVGVVDANTINLYTNFLNATALQYPITYHDIRNLTSLTLTDSRLSQVETCLVFGSDFPFVIPQGLEISFPDATLPSPLATNATYYANQIADKTLQIFSSYADAQNQANPVYLTGVNSAINVRLRKPIAPQTNLSFSVPHLYNTGDVVQAFTNGGTLPTPLVANQNYYVQVLDTQTVALHVNQADCFTGNNPIALQSAGFGSVSLVKLLPASVSLGTQNNITCAGLTIPTPVGSNATVKAIPSGPVTSVSVVTSGANYTSAPLVSFSSVGGNGYTSNPTVTVASNAGVNANITASAVNGVVTTLNIVFGGTGYALNDVLNFSGPGVGAVGHVSTVNGSGVITGVVLDAYGSGATATANMTYDPSTGLGTVNSITITSPGSGYVSNPIVSLSNGGGAGATATAAITTSFLNNFTVTAGGSGYLYPPIVQISGGGGSGAVAEAVVQGGVVKSINIISSGAGYTFAPTVKLIASTGVFVGFSSTGTLPSPLTQSAGYRAETPFSGNSFTVLNADYSQVNITDFGTGTFYVALSRTFSVSFPNTWSGDFTGLTTGGTVYFASDYLLPQTAPAIDSSTAYYIRVLSSTKASFFQTQAEALDGNNLTGIIVIDAFGTGQTYVAISLSATPTVLNNTILPSFIQYLNNNSIVQFTSSGTLPSPLTANTNYNIKLVGSGIQVYSSGTLVPLTTLGAGNLKLVISEDFTINPANSLIAENFDFEDGQVVQFRPNQGDILPYISNSTQLVDGTQYYTRRVDNNSYQIYATKDQALASPSTTGIFNFYKIGNATNSFFYMDGILPATLVKGIYHVEKPITQGYVSLYAWDNGRSNDMTLIGQYHPTETNPKYRRVLLGQACAWARIIYRAKAPKLTSLYDYIPLEQTRAILAATHAIDLEDKDFVDQSEKYWQLAITYLRNQQTSMDGHAMNPPQINNITYGDGTDWVMF